MFVSACTVPLPVQRCICVRVSVTKHHSADLWEVACIMSCSKGEGPQRRKQILKK